MTSAIRARREAEDGFTLIELLVVVIIIGILAAIAIPAFLNQRERAWQAETTSEVRNYALEVEAEATALGGAYPAAAAAATAGGSLLAANVPLPSPEDQVEITYTPVDADANGVNESFQVCGEHDLITVAHNVTYDSALGGVQPFDETGGC